MNVSDQGQYVLLTVWTEGISGTLSVACPAGLIPDATDPQLSGVHNYSSGEYVAFNFSDDQSFAEEFSSHAYRFFKASNFVSSEFSVTITDVNGRTKSATNVNIP